jgi:putative ABC transport system ATP-binding protein
MIEVEGLRRTFGSGPGEVHAVDGVSFTVPEGQLCAVVGRSGSGKTTLLNLIGGLDKPDSGRISVDGKQLAGPGRSLGEKELAALRRDLFGFVFQSFALIPILSAAENVGIPLRLRKTAVAEREARVELLLTMVGLGGHLKQRPGEMSGGQQQRVALARALANSPRVLIADEPTRAAGLRDRPRGDAAAACGGGRGERDGAGRHSRSADDGAGRPGDHDRRREGGRGYRRLGGGGAFGCCGGAGLGDF